MLESPPFITHVEAAQTAVVRLLIPRSEIQSMMGPAVQELMSVLRAQGMQPAGPLFSRHFGMHPDTFDFEVGVPVSAPVTPAGRVAPSSLPATRVARAVLKGDYSGLPSGWSGFLDWVAAHRFRTRPGFWEVYLSGPAADPDPSAWRTELNKPLLD